MKNIKILQQRDFPGGPVVKNPPCNAGDEGSIPDWGTEIPCATASNSQVGSFLVAACVYVCV